VLTIIFSEVLSWVVIAVSLLAIFVGGGYVIKRFFIDKKYFGGSQFVGRQIYEEFQNADRRESIEQVIYMEEEERQQDFTAGKDNPPDDDNSETKDV
jgi:hypothetical protein